MLELHPVRSRRLVVGLLMAHLAATALIVIVALRWPGALALLGVPLASLAWHRWGRGGYLHPESASDVVAVVHTLDGRWRLRERSGQVHEAALAPGTIVMPWLLLLCFTVPHQRLKRCLVVLGDSEHTSKLRAARRELLCNRPK